VLHMLVMALQTHQGQELELQRALRLTKEREHHKGYLGLEQATRSRVLLVLHLLVLHLLVLALRTSHHLELEQGLQNQTPQNPVLEQANQSHQILPKLALGQESSHRSQSPLLRLLEQEPHQMLEQEPHQMLEQEPPQMLEQEPHQMLEPVCFQMLELRVPPTTRLQSQSHPMPCYD
jgi:hypothetical protein